MSYVALLETAPSTSIGVPTGLGNWKLSVEILLPDTDSAIWGTSLWGSSEWASFAWVDITPWVRGLDWERGNDEPYGRPRVGEATITLDSTSDRWNPWNPSPPSGSPAYFACGTILRVSARSATDTRAGGWLPQFCGIVDEWTPTYVSAGRDRFVDVTVVETLRDLATIDNNALGYLVGGGETAQARWQRLLDASQWKYGFRVEAQHLLLAPTAYLMQSTDMANNRIAECYLVADSCDTLFRSDRKGRALATNSEYVGVLGASSDEDLPLGAFSKNGAAPFIGFDWYARTETGSGWTARYVPYDIDTFASTNSDDSVVNDARFARVGGAQQVSTQQASIDRFGRRTLARNDLICQSDASVALFAQYATLRRGLNTLRVNNVTVQVTDRGDEEGLVCIAADVQSQVRIYRPDGLTSGNRPHINGYLASLRHSITARNPNELSWTVAFAIDTRTVNNIPGAQLPAAT